MTMITLTSRPWRTAFNSTALLTQTKLQPLMSRKESRKNKHAHIFCFSSSTSHVNQRVLHSHNSLRNDQRSNNGLEKLKAREWGKTRRSNHRYWQRKINNEESPPLVQFSEYSYKIRTVSHSGSSHFLRYMNASALLDPLTFCKGSANVPTYMYGGSRTISGTDAARRLLKGKRDFLLAARELKNDPFLLDGHGVPSNLFQHCVDMADALLRHYGPDVVECSFHNHQSNDNVIGKEPRTVRIRRRDATNSRLPHPSFINGSGTSVVKDFEDQRENDEIDWDHNLTLYLTVMERLAKRLGPVLVPPSLKNDEGRTLVTEKNLESSQEQHHDNNIGEFDFASLLAAAPQPRWNVEISRGAYFDFEHVGSEIDSKAGISGRFEQPKQGADGKQKGGEDRQSVSSTLVDMDYLSTRIRPFPVVEFIQQKSSGSSGRVLIRLQGFPVANREFGSFGLQPHQQEPVTLVFDACIKHPTKANIEMHL